MYIKPSTNTNTGHFFFYRVIGAGGLGCEILKNLALSGFRDIHVIDMDTIDLSNLNRQFLFRKKDIGKAKAIVAAEFIEKRVKGVKVTPYFGKIQDKDINYYMQFAIVICGLDNIDARRWMNATLVNMAHETNPDSLKPLIDGGTEGFRGQSRVVIPTITSCIECSLDLYGPQVTYPLCTIANTPRQPEHCIEWASVLEWERTFPGKKLDGDNPEHIQWLFEKASERAKEFNITGVTWSLTQGIVKNIIPAIASTNAVIAASCCNEALKIATSCNLFMSNYMMYSGDESVYMYTYEYQKKENCSVCGTNLKHMDVPGDKTLEEFMEMLHDNSDVKTKNPSLTTAEKSLYFQQPAQLEQLTRKNLTVKMKDLVADGEQITVTDRNLQFPVIVQVKLV